MILDVTKKTKLDQLEFVLKNFGARSVDKINKTEGGDEIEIRVFILNNWFIEISESIRNGTGCRVSRLNDNDITDLSEKKWHSIFEFTEPDFSNFTQDQQVDWVLNMPSGDNYTEFLIEHIQKLNFV